jgi:hypothetical protein
VGLSGHIWCGVDGGICHTEYWMEAALQLPERETED